MSDSPPPPEPPAEPEVAIRTGSPEELDEASLVLTAMGLAHRVDQGALVTAPPVAALAHEALLAYAAENAPTAAPIDPPTYGDTAAGLVLALLILLTFAAQDAAGPRWALLGAADAARIRAGEWWRCATALSLHADAAHAGGNALFGGVALTALAHRLGPATAAWLALSSGAAGNALTALVLRQGQVSIGASTAVFGLLGALAGAQLAGPPARRRWPSLGAGIALLGLLGTGPQSDLFAHLFGMLAGLLLGALASVALRIPPRRSWPQPLLATASLAVLAACWWRALR